MAPTPDKSLEVGSVLRDARDGLGISIRELARRAAVSASQISRIEAGEIEKPSRETLAAIARGLGAPAAPLLVVAGQLRGDQARATLEAINLEVVGAIEDQASDYDRLSEPLGMRSLDEGQYVRQMHDFADRLDESEDLRGPARALFLAPTFSGRVDSAVVDDEDARRELAEIARAWPGLSAERRRLVLAYVADQEVLSTQERKQDRPGRYDIDVQLTPRSADDGR